MTGVVNDATNPAPTSCCHVGGVSSVKAMTEHEKEM